MAKKKQRFVIYVRVKPYVKRYLLQNYRVWDEDWPELVNVSSDNELRNFIDTRLQKPSHRFDKRTDNKMYRRTEQLAVEISEDKFYRYGWTLSPTDESAFNEAVAIRCNTILLVLLNCIYCYTGNLNEAIRKFRRITEFSEDDWSTDSIRKIWNRAKRMPKITIKNELINKNMTFFLEQLSKNGTIAQTTLEQYENNAIQS